MVDDEQSSIPVTAADGLPRETADGLAAPAPQSGGGPRLERRGGMVSTIQTQKWPTLSTERCTHRSQPPPCSQSSVGSTIQIPLMPRS